MKTKSKVGAGVREDARTGQYFPQVDGKDIGVSTYDPDRAQRLADESASAREMLTHRVKTDAVQFARDVYVWLMAPDLSAQTIAEMRDKAEAVSRAEIEKPSPPQPVQAGTHTPLLLLLGQIQNNASARAWNSADRTDVDAFKAIQEKAAEASEIASALTNSHAELLQALRSEVHELPTDEELSERTGLNVEDWVQEVGQGNTRRSYSDWLNENAESMKGGAS